MFKRIFERIRRWVITGSNEICPPPQQPQQVWAAVDIPGPVMAEILDLTHQIQAYDRCVVSAWSQEERQHWIEQLIAARNEHFAKIKLAGHTYGSTCREYFEQDNPGAMMVNFYSCKILFPIMIGGQ